MSFPVGGHLGRYELLDEIGGGNYGSVYRARKTGAHGFSKIVALKILSSAINDENRKEVRALINEARIGGFLKHSGIVDTYEFGEEDGKLFIAMEYVDGITLGDVIRGLRRQHRFFPLSLVVEIGISVASSLAYAHERNDEDSQGPLGLVHRDLKPDNVMLTRSGEVKILDFGIAVSAANLFRTTLKNMTKGTPAYMSPEQVMGVEDLDARSDLFGLAAVLVELITTEQLFDGTSWTDTMELVLHKEIGNTLEWIGIVSTELRELLEDMLERDRSKRVKSARDVARRLVQLRGRYSMPAPLSDAVEAIRAADWQVFPGEFIGSRDWAAPTPAGAFRLYRSDMSLASLESTPGLQSPARLRQDADGLSAEAAVEPPRMRRGGTVPSPVLAMPKLNGSLSGPPEAGAPTAPEVQARSGDLRARTAFEGPRPVEMHEDERTPESLPARAGDLASPGAISSILQQRNVVLLLIVLQSLALIVLTIVLILLLLSGNFGASALAPLGSGGALAAGLLVLPERTPRGQ
jgi:serine/threonine-protein kinase